MAKIINLNIFWANVVFLSVADPDPGSGVFLPLDQGSGINIPDPQH
jgi:hypothetical protein